MKDRKMVFISVPFKGDMELNNFLAKQACRCCAEQSHTPIAPGLFFGPLFDLNNIYQRDACRNMGFDLLEKCDELWACGDRITREMQTEIERGKRLGIPVRRIPMAQLFPQEEQFGIWAKATGHTRLKGQSGFLCRDGWLLTFPDRETAESHMKLLGLRRLNNLPAAEYRVEPCERRNQESVYRKLAVEKIEELDLAPDFDPNGYVVEDTIFANTGGGCMVATLKCRLPELDKRVWINTDDEGATVNVVDVIWGEDDIQSVPGEFDCDEATVLNIDFGYDTPPEDAGPWLPMIRDALAVTIKRQRFSSVPANWIPQAVRQTMEPEYLEWLEQKGINAEFESGKPIMHEAYLRPNPPIRPMEMGT